MHKEPEVDIKRTCRFIEYSDLEGPVFSQRQSDLVCEALTNSEISFGNNNRTMVSLGRMCEIIRCTDGIEPDEATCICDKLCEVLDPGEYIDVEN
jgi:hypothetical protein